MSSKKKTANIWPRQNDRDAKHANPEKTI